MLLQEHGHRKLTWFVGPQSIAQKINCSYSLILKNGQNFLLFAENFTKLSKIDVLPKIFVKMT